MIKSLFILFFSFCSIFENSDSQKNTPSIKKTEFVKPPFLKKGDSILILAPAGKIRNQEDIQAGIDLAESWGLHVKFGANLYQEHNSFAGTDEQRLNDLQAGLDNPNIKMIWPARGGYGTVRIIDALNFEQFEKSPKWIVGFSDITILHNKIHNLGVQTIHGPMPGTIELNNSIQKEAIVSLKNSLFGKKIKYAIDTNKNNRKGKSEGILVGGNLSILYSMLGSQTSIDTSEKIIFLEDVSEPLYSIDRMMISLKRAGYFKNVKGIIVGDFKLKSNESNPFGKTLEEIVLEAVNDVKIPVIFNFPAGHLNDNRVLIFGSEVKIITTNKKTIIVF